MAGFDLLHTLAKPFKWLTESKAAHKADEKPSEAAAAGASAHHSDSGTGLHNSLAAETGAGWHGASDRQATPPDQADKAHKNAALNVDAGVGQEPAKDAKSDAPAASSAVAGPGHAQDKTFQGGISEAEVLKRAAEIKDPSKPYLPPSKFDEDKNGTKDSQELQYSANGIPITVEAWAMQSAIDGGKLLRVYQTLEAAAKQKQPPETLTDQAVINAYLAEAKSKGKDAAFMAEVLPTETGLSDTKGALQEHFAGRDPKCPEMQGTASVGQIRLGNMQIAQQLQAAPGNENKELYSLVVPYSNTPENILANQAIPQDGVNKLSEYLKAVGPESTSVATGYSQGGGVVSNYVNQHGNQDGLDYSVALAPMGGNDRHGANGVHQGTQNGVNSLSIMHALDPAQHLYDPTPGREKAGSNIDLIDRMIDFASSKNGWLHGDAYADDAKRGTYGYQMKDAAPLVHDLFAQGPAEEGAKDTYHRTGDWTHMPTDADRNAHDQAEKADNKREFKEDKWGWLKGKLTDGAMNIADKLFDSGAVDKGIDLGQRVKNGFNKAKKGVGGAWDGLKSKGKSLWDGLF